MIVVFSREAFYNQQVLNIHNVPNVLLVAFVPQKKKKGIMILFLEYVKIFF